MTEPRSNHRKWIFWLLVAAGICAFLALIHTILLPFVLGIFTAYFLDPPADRLERWGLSRAMATTVITACFFLGLAMLIVLIVPVLIEQMSGLMAALPGYIDALNREYLPELTRWLGRIPPPQAETLQSAATDVSGMVVELAGKFIGEVFQSGMAVFTVLSLILITPVVAFYLLRDWDRIIANMDALLPQDHAETIREQARIVDRTLAGFIRGQLNVCLLMGTYYALGLSLVGLKFGVVIGFATGLLAIVPYAGFMLGCITGLAVALFQFDGAMPVAWVAAVFMTGQVLESYLVTPRLVGDRVGLHPVWIIFGMLAGAALLGFVGALLAVPATAVLGVLLRFLTGRYMQSEYYRGRLRNS